MCNCTSEARASACPEMTTSNHHWRIRQFVAVPAMRGKMRRQLSRDRLDPLDDAAFEIPRFEIGLHVLADFFPAGGADFCIDATIGDNLDVAVGQQQLDQHAVVVDGVPDAQVRKNIQRAFPRRLIAEQRRAVQRALHDKADLAGMRGLARFDRLRARGQHVGRKNPPYPPAVLKKMSADAPDAHIYQLLDIYQLPDAPPPPKLPPPPLNPPLSLELLPEYEPPPLPPAIQPTPPPRPRGAGEVMLSPNITKIDAMTPASNAASREPTKYQAINVTRLPVATEPISRPNVLRMKPPNSNTGMMRNGLSRSMELNEPGLCRCAAAGVGSVSPSITRTIRSTPAEMPPAKSPLLNLGVMTSSMMRLAVTSLSAPSRPSPTSMGSLRSSLATTSSAPSSIFLRPIFQASATRIEYCSMLSGAVVGTISTATWLPLRSSRFFKVCVSASMSPLPSVPVRSTTRPVSGGTATSANATEAQHTNSASKKLLAAFIAGKAGAPGYLEGAAGAGLKSTFGAVEISFSFSTVKFGFSL